MNVITLKLDEEVNGWQQNAGGLDCPKGDSDWPNTDTELPCTVAVWLY